MELSNATLDELLTLKLAISIANERVRQAWSDDKAHDLKPPTVDHVANLKLWADRITEAEVDIMFEQTKLS